ncbi:MAG: serine/threonine protein kinase, partial [Lentisphaerae bacterium]
MGTVYLAHQISLDRPVALKILKEQYARDNSFILDFVREARAAAKLNHPNIVQAYAVGEEDGTYFFAMEFVEGKTLKRIMNEKRRLEWRRGFHIGMQVAEALDFAWKNQHLIHRDIKPDNIMITPRGVAKLADLGLARAATELQDDEEEVMGTPQYICPEQLLGQP